MGWPAGAGRDMSTAIRILAAEAGRFLTSEQRARLSHQFQRFVEPAWPGTLRRTKPLSEHWGTERGTPIDRYYIARFLQRYRADIRGRVLEVKDSGYTDRFGCDVTGRDVLDIDPANRAATILVDLANAEEIPSESFDCFILTQTLQYIYDPASALWHAWRILRPGGVLLVTVPGLSRLAPPLVDYWHFTPGGCSRLLSEIFGPGAVSVFSYGNVLAATAVLTGMAAEELRARELLARDVRYPVIVAARAVKVVNG
jgi:SAM-dependent methyltransferase